MTHSTNYLFILNDPPYGTERSYNGLRLAGALAKRDGARVRVFLMADAVFCAKTGQKTPDGFYNIGRMVSAAARQGVEFGACGTCMTARGMTVEDTLPDVRHSTLEELVDLSEWADQVFVF